MTGSLYERDFYAWTQDQVAALRRAGDMRINLPGIDVQNLAEELADMGNDTLDKIEGVVVQIIAHLLKLAHSRDESPRNHWLVEVTAWRTTVRRRARRSPTALDRLDLDDLTHDALKVLRRDDTHRSWATSLTDECPFTLDQVLDDEFVPTQSCS
jgi:hypothetical protein